MSSLFSSSSFLAQDEVRVVSGMMSMKRDGAVLLRGTNPFIPYWPTPCQAFPEFVYHLAVDTIKCISAL